MGVFIYTDSLKIGLVKHPHSRPMDRSANSLPRIHLVGQGVLKGKVDIQCHFTVVIEAYDSDEVHITVSPIVTLAKYY